MSAHWRQAATAVTFAVAWNGEMSAQANVSRAELAERVARAQLDSGKFSASRETFAGMLRVSATRKDSASSIFGKAFAEQQTIELDSVSGAVASRLIRDYRQAVSLDPSRYRSAAQLNIALLHSAAGRHDSAAGAYLHAATLNESRRGPMLLDAARELRLAGQRDRAVTAARQAAAVPSVAPDAQALLVELYYEGREMRAIVGLADTLQSRTAPLAQVNERLAEMMQDRAWSSTSWGERCLIILARNYAALDVGPVHFTETQRPALERAVRANDGTEIGRAMAALIDVYRRRDSLEVYEGHPGDAWWARRTPSDARRATWSRTLRGLGDWYARTGATRVAISFYEWALGSPSMPVDEEWVDLEALPPLPALYATLPDTGAYWDRIYRVKALTDALFQGKSSMRPDNARRLRLVRLTLGHLFAQQQRWDNGWFGAIYQLEESRRLARRMAAENPGEAPHFPPEVYEMLFAEYVRRGCRTEALSVGADLQEEYDRRSAVADRDRITAEMSRLQSGPPRPTRGSCTGS